MTPTRAAAGGVVYCYDDADRLLLLLIHDKYGAWTLPKGHLDDRETEAVAAKREIAEETSVECEIGPLVQRIAYPVQKHGTQHTKTVAYFLARTAHTPPIPQADEGISAAEWMEPQQALAAVGYAQVRDVMRQGLTMLGINP